MTTEEEDDRWSNFRDHGMKHHLGTKVSNDPEPELADYLRVVLAKKSPRDRQERKYLVSFIMLVITIFQNPYVTAYLLLYVVLSFLHFFL